MTITLYGISNCGQVKKARAWLDVNGHVYHFHDFKKASITTAIIEGWLKHVSWETLINRRGTTWRALPENRKATIIDASNATVLMLESPSVVKRPVLMGDSFVYVSFSPTTYQAHLQES